MVHLHLATLASALRRQHADVATEDDLAQIHADLGADDLNGDPSGVRRHLAVRVSQVGVRSRHEHRGAAIGVH